MIVFADTEEDARAAAAPLRAALWGDHTLSVLLPGGEEPTKVRPPCQALRHAGHGKVPVWTLEERTAHTRSVLSGGVYVYLLRQLHAGVRRAVCIQWPVGARRSSRGGQ